MKSPQERAQTCQEAQWQTILNLSRQMLEYAENRDWNSLQDKISVREKLLPTYFDTRSKAQKISEKLAHITMLQNIDGQILELTTKNKDLLAKEIVKLQNGRNGLAAYAASLSN
jgi:Flagellar protein FliT